MSDFTRRDVLKAGVAATSLATAGGLLPAGAAAQTAAFKLEPEKGARLRVLRWSQFVQGDWDKWVEYTKKFTQTTGIEVRVDKESWEDIRPKAAVAANVGAGPDIIIGTNDDPHKFPDKLVELTDLANYLGGKYGGWYESCKQYGMRGNKWIALPQGGPGNAMNYRISHMKAAGFDEFPKDFPGFLKLCQGLKAKGTPAGFALGHATGDGNSWTHWILWGHGAKMVDKKNNVTINSPETIAALEYAKQLYPTFVPGVASWLDPSNNKAFLDGQCSLTANGISIYTVAKTSNDPALQAIAKDMDHAFFPVGPVGMPTEQAIMLQAYVFKYTKYPNAAKEYLRFMWEREQYVPWQEASNGYVSQPLAAYETNPIWTADPKNLPFRDAVKRMRYTGYEGTL
ncbi:MAG: carbohydrate ABC transporter substrate-binding protein, partial [Alphaproteobacteria bacterium]|nr:carbohydrate ABC transporter substrate-binding protein [Alphaproteobacteria bacterium]